MRSGLQSCVRYTVIGNSGVSLSHGYVVGARVADYNIK